jgi:hypothetical protein
MWLGDGKVKRGRVLGGEYKLVIAAKDLWRLGLSVGTYEALVATGREAYLKLRESAGVYGVLLDLLKAHKWVVVKSTTDDGFRAAFKLNRKRGIDRLRRRIGKTTARPPLSHTPRRINRAPWLWQCRNVSASCQR